MAKDKSSKKAMKLVEEELTPMVKEKTDDVLQDKLLNRLRRVEGQVRGIHKMVEEQRDPQDIIIQLAAIQSALNKVSMNLLEKHTKQCVTNAVKSGNSEKAAKELTELMERFMN